MQTINRLVDTALRLVAAILATGVILIATGVICRVFYAFWKLGFNAFPI